MRNGILNYHLGAGKDRGLKNLRQRWVLCALLLSTLSGWLITLDDRYALLVIGLLLFVVVYQYPIVGLVLMMALVPLGSIRLPMLTASKAAGWLTFAAWLARKLFRRESFDRILDESKSLSPIVAFSVWAVLSVGWSTYYGDWWFSVRSYVQLLLLILLLIDLVDSEEKIKWLFIALIVSASLSSLAAGVQFFVGGGSWTERVTGLHTDPNKLASTLAVAIPLSFYFLFSVKSWAARILFFSVIAVLSLGVAVSLSRTGWISLFIIILLGMRTSIADKRAKVWRLLFVLFLLVISLVWILSSFDAFYVMEKRLLALFPGRASILSTLSRLPTWRVAGIMIGENWLLGVGSGNFVPLFPQFQALYKGPAAVYYGIGDRKAAHNAFIEIWAELGLVGLLIFGVILLQAFANLRKTRTVCARTNLLDGALTDWLGIAVLVYVFFGIFLNIEESKILWGFVGLTIAMRRLGETGTREIACIDVS